MRKKSFFVVPTTERLVMQLGWQQHPQSILALLPAGGVVQGVV
jgi:hypothetical protein